MGRVPCCLIRLRPEQCNRPSAAHGTPRARIQLTALFYQDDSGVVSLPRLPATADPLRPWRRQFRRPNLERLARSATFKKVLDRCKACRRCPHCGAVNGTVKCAHPPYFSCRLSSRFVMRSREQPALLLLYLTMSNASGLAHLRLQCQAWRPTFIASVADAGRQRGP